jgi:hypothetical protein
MNAHEKHVAVLRDCLDYHAEDRHYRETDQDAALTYALAALEHPLALVPEGEVSWYCPTCGKHCVIRGDDGRHVKCETGMCVAANRDGVVPVARDRLALLEARARCWDAQIEFERLGDLANDDPTSPRWSAWADAGGVYNDACLALEALEAAQKAGR